MGLDQLIISWLIFFFILITRQFNIVLILLGEILSWSLMGFKGLTRSRTNQLLFLFFFLKRCQCFFLILFYEISSFSCVQVLSHELLTKSEVWLALVSIPPTFLVSIKGCVNTENVLHCFHERFLKKKKLKKKGPVANFIIILAHSRPSTSIDRFLTHNMRMV